MIEVTTTTVKKEGVIQGDGCHYRVLYDVVNGIITRIAFSVIKEVDGVFNEIGNITKENGHVNSFIRESEPYIAHLTAFELAVKEIEGENNIIEQTS